MCIRDSCLTVKKGETFGFIGKNGAGKSTTIKACVGIHDYDLSLIHILLPYAAAMTV